MKTVIFKIDQSIKAVNTVRNNKAAITTKIVKSKFHKRFFSENDQL